MSKKYQIRVNGGEITNDTEPWEQKNYKTNNKLTKQINTIHGIKI